MAEWKPYPADPRYLVSSDGEVIGPSGRVLVQLRHRDGYREVQPGSKHRMVHRMVLETFVGPRPPGHEAAHLDGVRHHNALSNLRWVSHSENELRKRKHGTGTGAIRRCFRGHEYSEANTKIRPHGGRNGTPARECLECRRLRNAARYNAEIDQRIRSLRGKAESGEGGKGDG